MENEKMNLVKLKNISKSFPGVKTVQNVSVNFFTGEVISILGQNGAGKRFSSTG